MKLPRALFGILLSVSTWAASASAAIDPKTRDHLRDLMNEGGALFEQNQTEAALGKWSEVLKVVHIPGAALWAARANVKLNRLRAAAELYASAQSMQQNELWKGNAQQEAQVEAKQELEALKARVPTLKIEVEGVVATDTVTVDGANVDVAALASALQLDPGAHVVVATRDGKSVTQNVQLSEGQHLSAKLRFEAEAPSGNAPTPPIVAPAPIAPAATPLPNSAATQPVVAAPPQTKNQTHEYAMWTSFGIGAAGLVVGTTAGLMAWSKHSSLEDSGCNGSECYDTSLQGKMDSYNNLRPIATAGFIIAGVGAAAGVTLWLTKPKAESVGSVSLVVGPGGLVAQGRY